MKGKLVATAHARPGDDVRDCEQLLVCNLPYVALSDRVWGLRGWLCLDVLFNQRRQALDLDWCNVGVISCIAIMGWLPLQ